jgi:hypothetical protein
MGLSPSFRFRRTDPTAHAEETWARLSGANAGLRVACVTFLTIDTEH